MMSAPRIWQGSDFMDPRIEQIYNTISRLSDIKDCFWKDFNNMNLDNLKAQEDMRAIIEDICRKIDASIDRIGAL